MHARKRALSCGGTLGVMDSQRRTATSVRDIWRLALALIGVAAIIQELRKPQNERTWHGKVADIVPYDFRIPTIDRIRTTYWNPEGPAISAKVFGVGWAPNFGALAKLLPKGSDADQGPSDQ
jgi:hypothetical protein